MDADTKSLLFNVIGGIIVSVLTAIYVGARHRFRSYQEKAIGDVVNLFKFLDISFHS